jgi:hypothetical protein
MLRFVIDENFNTNIARGLLRRNRDLDIVRVQDVGLSGADDPAILEWAANERRVLLTHDVTTMTKHAFGRIETGRPMPGVFQVGHTLRPLAPSSKMCYCWQSVV